LNSTLRNDTASAFMRLETKILRQYDEMSAWVLTCCNQQRSKIVVFLDFSKARMGIFFFRARMGKNFQWIF
jgi:hypothetical protein